MHNTNSSASAVDAVREEKSPLAFLGIKNETPLVYQQHKL
jgi:hypothetical protein